MPTTSNFGWTTPADTDLVKDGALAIRTLGNGIDTSLVDLKGGTTGQNLRKASNTDLDFTFAGDATNTVVDAAGDLLYGTAADTLGRLAIGTAGQILQVNAGATAPEWAAPAGAAFVGARAKRNTNISISNATDTVVAFNLEDYDTDAFHDNVTNNSRMTIPAGKGGKYLIVGQFNFASNSTGWRQMGILKNGGFVGEQRTNAINGAGTIMTISFVDALAVADYLEMSVYQNSSASLNGGDGAYFSITFLGA